jgi:hypothetical protein
MNKVLDFTSEEWEALEWAISYTIEQWMDHPDWEEDKERVAASHLLEAIRQRMED